MKIDLSQAQKMLEWLKTKLLLDSLSKNAASRTVKRGQVYKCNFGCGVGSEMQKNRPAVIIQNDIGNIKSGNTIVIPITHDTSSLPCIANITTQLDASGNIILDGQANASNIMCISKSRLGDLICELPASDIKLIDISIAKVLELMSYYSNLSKKLDDKLTYISKIKEDRNNAQDELIEIRSFLGIDKTVSIIEYLKEKGIDKE